MAATDWDDVAREAELVKVADAVGVLRGPRERPAPEPVGVQLARRRAAAHRCQPLPSGHRDPHDQDAEVDERFVRRVANALAALGFDLDYIAHRYDVNPRRNP